MNARCGPSSRRHSRQRTRNAANGIDAEVEVEPGQVPERPLRHLAHVVVLVARRLVRAEHRERRAAAQRLGDDRDDRDSRHRPVQDAEAPEPAPPEQERRGEDRRKERDRLRARREGDECDPEHEELPLPRRPLEHQHEHERRGQEDRIERVLGHQRARVDHRGHRDREQRRHEREPLREHAAGEEVRRHGRERHRDRVDRLRRGVGARHRAEEAPRGRDHERVDEPVRAGRLVADQEVARRSDALRELRVDELVDHDPGRRHPAPERVAEPRRDDDDPRQIGPRRDRARAARAAARPGRYSPSPTSRSRLPSSGTSSESPTSAPARATSRRTASRTASPPAACSSAAA